MTLKPLFITRNYPPKVGGLEEYSYHLNHLVFLKLRLCRFRLFLGKWKVYP